MCVLLSVPAPFFISIPANVPLLPALPVLVTNNPVTKLVVSSSICNKEAH